MVGNQSETVPPVAFDPSLIKYVCPSIRLYSLLVRNSPKLERNIAQKMASYIALSIPKLRSRIKRIQRETNDYLNWDAQAGDSKAVYFAKLWCHRHVENINKCLQYAQTTNCSVNVYQDEIVIFIGKQNVAWKIFTDK